MTKTKSWSYTTGEKGRNRVRAFEDAKTGMIHLEYHTEEGRGERRKRRTSTGHRDRVKAKQTADELAAAFGRNEPPPTVELTLRKLFDIYTVEVTPMKGESKRKHDLRCAEMFLRFLGENRKASTLSRREWDRFIHERRSGKIGPAQATEGKQVGERVIGYDLTFLRGVLNWATLAGDGKGGMLLDRNPLKGLPMPREESPQRPLVLQDRYEAMLSVADQVDPRFRLALVLAHETGHRIASVRQLRWSDVDLRGKLVRWRAESDKLKWEHVTPLSVDACSVLEDERRKNPAVGDAWIFPSPSDPAEPCSRNLARDWWYRAERLAGLEHVARMGWHSLRRKFGTELKANTNLKDLCALGGWKNPQTILTCYMQPDQVTMRDALANRRPLAAAGGM